MSVSVESRFAEVLRLERKSESPFVFSSGVRDLNHWFFESSACLLKQRRGAKVKTAAGRA